MHWKKLGYLNHGVNAMFSMENWFYSPSQSIRYSCCPENYLDAKLELGGKDNYLPEIMKIGRTRSIIHYQILGCYCHLWCFLYIVHMKKNIYVLWICWKFMLLIMTLGTFFITSCSIKYWLIHPVKSCICDSLTTC